MKDQQTLRALRLWLGLQVMASVIANELGAEPTWQARIVALPAPLILFGSIESMLRIPGGRDLISVVRGLATIAIGSAAAFLSFATIGHLGSEAGLSVQEQIALVITIDGGMLVVALTLLMVSSRQRPPRRKPQRTLRLAAQRPTETPVSFEVQEPDDLDDELSTEDRRELVLTRTNAGDLARDIADLTGVHVRTIRRDLAALKTDGRLPQEAPA